MQFTRLFGIDFTSAPRKAKPITVASGHLTAEGASLEGLFRFHDWAGFEAFLRTPGPWLGSFDFPFGLPREAVADLGWPTDWPALVRHCADMGKSDFKRTLDAYRQTRPVGTRYPHRRVDGPAGSHSPLKLVNPPVGLMFLEGAPRLLEADLSLPGLFVGDPTRVAVEAYPGLLARRITRAPYKSDDRARQTPARQAARLDIIMALRNASAPTIGTLCLSDEHAQALVEDASGDLLDAALALMQAHWCARQAPPMFGLPAGCDPLEGWIATVTSDCALDAYTTPCASMASATFTKPATLAPSE